MPDGPESRCGMHIFLCLICRERRRVPGITGRIVAVRCGRGVWFCVFAERFLLSFGGLLKYSIQCVISRLCVSSSDPLLLLGFLCFLREASSCCLGEVPGSVLGVTSYAGASWFWKP